MGNPDYQFSLLLTICLMLIMLVLAWPHRHLKGGKPFLFFTLLASFYAVCSIGEYQASGLDQKMIWRNIQQIPIFFLPVFLYYAVMTFLRYDRRRVHRWMIWLSSAAATYVLLIMTDVFHHWMRTNVMLEEVDGFVRTNVEPTYLNLLFIAGNGLVVFLTMLIMLMHAVSAAKGVRMQYWMLFLALLFPGIHGALKFLSSDADQIPLAVSYAPSVLFLYYGLFRYRLKNLFPEAGHVVYEHMQDGVVLLDQDGVITFFNQKSKRMLQSMNASFREISQGQHMMDFLMDFDELAELFGSGKDQSLEIEVGTAPVRSFHIDRLNLLDHHEETIGQLWILKDYTDRRLRENELWRRATEDSLTGLMNRQYFMEQLESAVQKRSSSQYITMLLLDIDYFKRVNDRYGHYTGDEVLRHFAGLMKKHTSERTFAGRIGGEEFAVFHLADGPSEGLEIAERILEEVREATFSSEEITFRCTISIGAVVSNRTMAASELYKRSDAALYRSKENGRNQLTVEYNVEHDVLKEVSVSENFSSEQS